MSTGGRTYLDHASGEPLHPAAREVLLQALERGYADARRVHLPAREARLMLDNARAVVAECLEVRPDEVTFTPSGTHAIHLGVLGLLAGQARTGRRMLVGAVEHSAVLHAASWHERQGGSSQTVPVDHHGRLVLDTLRASLDASTDAAVMAVQSANHEVGTLQPVDDVGALRAERHQVFTDACASMGRLPLPTGWDAAAGSAHKWGGPAGVGVLLVRKGARWRQPFPADDRLDERSTGFENVPAALAAAAALQAVVAERAELNRRLHGLVAEVRREVARIPDTEVVGDPEERLPHLVTFSCLYVAGEALVTELDRQGFAVASGSACTASSLEPSHVLAAMGALTHGNVRLSVGRDTDPGEVRRLLRELPDVVTRLRRESGMQP